MLKPTSDADAGAVPTTPSGSIVPTTSHRSSNIAIFEALQKAGVVTVIHIGDTPRPLPPVQAPKAVLAVPTPANEGGHP